MTSYIKLQDNGTFDLTPITNPVLVEYFINGDRSNKTLTSCENWEPHHFVEYSGLYILPETFNPLTQEILSVSLENDELILSTQNMAVTESDIIDLKNRINTIAELKRAALITYGVGKAMEYAYKAEEARAFMNDPSPLPEEYPLLASEVGFVAPTLAEVATIVIQKHTEYKDGLANINNWVRNIKNSIDLCTTKEEAEAIRLSIIN